MDGQIVNCEETSSFLCSNPQSIFSGGLSIHVLPSGVTQPGTFANNFILRPNPNNGDFTISGTIRNPGDEKVNVEITDVLGQIVYEETTNAVNGNVNERISLARTFARGMYMVSVTSGEDHVVFHVLIDK